MCWDHYNVCYICRTNKDLPYAVPGEHSAPVPEYCELYGTAGHVPPLPKGFKRPQSEECHGCRNKRKEANKRADRRKKKDDDEKKRTKDKKVAQEKLNQQNQQGHGRPWLLK
ncbi:hypothetical protein T440DRAFT_519083 [Plenodomus tracheiphilus IPT5]|uniref:Uncharacterized protein n=1 Tax=Plenodomus tracheiphilus IPT5 TaxID=1408161 RepID=A0A6A7B2U6_9PLEO|nr:hypothetical protein T440DRAFT_519083 [Plenodomus tracheiphilus IPT5]